MARPELGVVPNQLLTKFTVAVACAGLAISASASASQESNDPFDRPGATEQCYDPSQASFKAVERLISAEPNRSAIRHYNSTQLSIRKKMRVLDRQETDSTEGMKVYLKIAESIIKPYSVSFSTQPSKGYNEKDGEYENPNTVENLDVTGRAAVKAIVTGITRLPVKYVALSGVRNVELYSSPYNSDDRQASASYHNQGVISYDIATAGKPEIVAHEIYHFLDMKECSIPPADSKFTSIDGNGSIYDFPDPRKALDNEATKRELGKFSHELKEAAERGDRRGYKTLLADKRTLLDSIVTVSSYSFENATEDKAEIASYFGNPKSLLQKITPATQILYKKMKFIFARLYERSPAAAKSLLELSARPDSRSQAFTAPYDRADRYKQIRKHSLQSAAK